MEGGEWAGCLGWEDVPSLGALRGKECALAGFSTIGDQGTAILSSQGSNKGGLAGQEEGGTWLPSNPQQAQALVHQEPIP